MKKRKHQLNRKLGINGHASFFINANCGVPLNGYESAELFVRQLGNRLRNVVDRFTLFAGQGKNRVTTELGQSATQLRLKDHDQGNGQKHRKAAHDPADDNKIQ